MTNKSNRRLGLVLAVGLFAVFTAASPKAAIAGEPKAVGNPPDISRNLSVGQTVVDDRGSDVSAASQAAQPAATDQQAVQQPAVSAQQAESPATAQAASSDDGAGWDTTALIGKVLIGVGTLLTLGSAARMLMG